MHSVFNLFPPPHSPYQSFLVMDAKRDFFFLHQLYLLEVKPSRKQNLHKMWKYRSPVANGI